MVKPDAPVLETVAAREIQQAFVRGSGGKIFFVWQKGRYPLRFIVFDDGTISQNTDDFPIPEEMLDVIDNEKIGITEIKYAEEGTKVTF